MKKTRKVLILIAMCVVAFVSGGLFLALCLRLDAMEQVAATDRHLAADPRLAKVLQGTNATNASFDLDTGAVDISADINGVLGQRIKDALAVDPTASSIGLMKLKIELDGTFYTINFQ